MSKVSIDRKRHVLKAISWNLLAMTTTYLVLTLLPPFFGLEGISKEGAGQCLRRRSNLIAQELSYRPEATARHIERRSGNRGQEFLAHLGTNDT